MARSKKSAKGKKKSASVDFAGVDSSSRSIEDGWAHAEILEAELATSANDNEMFSVKVQLTRGKEKAVAYDNLVLTPNALWKIKGLLEAAGVEVPEGEMDIEEKDLVGLEFEAEVVNENFEGKDRPKLVSFRPSGDDEEEEEDEEDDEDDDEDDDEEDDEEEEAPKSKKKSSKKSKAKDDDEDEEEDSDDEEEDDDSDDDDDEDDEEEDDDDDEEEEDEKPKKKGKSKAKLRAGQKVTFTDDKDKVRKGVITSIDDDTIFVEDSKGDEWELSADEITVSK